MPKNNPKRLRPRQQLTGFEPTRTQQHQKDETDIHTIIRRATGGLLPQGNRQLQYGDFSNVTDYKSALDQVDLARQGFKQLSNELRDRFDHDPRKLLAFLDDPSNEEEARTLGILPPLPAGSSAASNEASEPAPRGSQDSETDVSKPETDVSKPGESPPESSAH